MKTKILFAILFTALIAGCDRDLDNVDCGTVPATYANDIKPLVTSNCTTSGCHGAGSVNGDYTTYPGLKAVADNGQLDERVIKKRDMPEDQPLSLDDRKKIKCWLNNGAPNN